MKTTTPRPPRCLYCQRRSGHELEPLEAADSRFARCVPCGAILPLTPDVMQSAGVPDGVTIERAPGMLTLRLRWYRWWYLLLFFPAAALFAVSLLILLGAFAWLTTSDAPPPVVSWSIVSWGVLLFGVLSVVASGSILYWWVAKVVNSTTLMVSPKEIWISHGPLWWPDHRTLPADEGRCYYSIEVPATKGTKKALFYSYTLVYRAGGVHYTLMEDIASPLAALYLQQTLQAFLAGEELPMEKKSA